LIDRANFLREIFGNPYRPLLFVTPIAVPGGYHHRKLDGSLVSIRESRSRLLDAAWLTSNVVGLCRTIYEDNRWDLMPILSDALQESGCEDEEILGHCCAEVKYYEDGGCAYWWNTANPAQTHLTPDRAKHTHVRGCWVTDALLNLS